MGFEDGIFFFQTCVFLSTNCTPRYEMANRRGRLKFVIADCEPIAPKRSPRLIFCIDFRVDSVPRNSLTTVEPKYWKKEMAFLVGLKNVTTTKFLHKHHILLDR